MSTGDRKNKRCPGCKRMFTISGYGRHLAQTTKAACIAAREVEFKAGFLDTDSEAAGDFSQDGSRATSPATSSNESRPGDPNDSAAGDFASQHEADGEEPAPVPFEGDYFGPYAPADFDNFDEYVEDGGENATGDQANATDGAHETAPVAAMEDDGQDGDAEKEEEEDIERDADYLEDERGWEPPPRPIPGAPDPSAEEGFADNIRNRAAYARAQEHI
ncbi:hypothetical protein OH77DRAFT_1526007 [Trametes cingulata]|nr:hypothetical protein OH77DRAFT_1526007 [Trametes cingulata]